jgi:hypothetical protein
MVKEKGKCRLKRIILMPTLKSCKQTSKASALATRPIQLNKDLFAAHPTLVGRPYIFSDIFWLISLLGWESKWGQLGYVLKRHRCLSTL